MTLMLDIRSPDWIDAGALREHLAALLPGARVLLRTQVEDASEVEMLACDSLAAGLAGTLANLRLVQKLGAGVESIVGAPDLAPHVRVARLKPDAPAQEIAEYCVAYVLQAQRNVRFHALAAAQGAWRALAPRRSPETTVGVMGLGHIGARTARAFAGLDFAVMGWSRSQKAIDGVKCLAGEAGLAELLGASDYVCSVLPSTPATRDLFDAARLAAMKPGAVLVNVGRGDLIADEALLASLDAGHLGGAVLDVFRTEPLPADHPFWRHPKVTVTPHVSGWHLTGGFDDVAENYKRLKDGRPLLHEVDRQAGY